MRTLTALFATGLLTSVVAATPAFAQQQRPAQATGPTEMHRSGGWASFSVNDPRGRFCYAIASPTSADPPVAAPRRDPTNVFITARPRQNVRNEISIIIGYTFRENSNVNIEITGGGAQRFTMFTRANSAFVENAAQETQMIAALRAGRELIVRGTSARGTATTDRYSLAGIGAVLDHMAANCR